MRPSMAITLCAQVHSNAWDSQISVLINFALAANSDVCAFQNLLHHAALLL